jgi:hypothetical protein
MCVMMIRIARDLSNPPRLSIAFSPTLRIGEMGIQLVLFSELKRRFQFTNNFGDSDQENKYG